MVVALVVCQSIVNCTSFRIDWYCTTMPSQIFCLIPTAVRMYSTDFIPKSEAQLKPLMRRSPGPNSVRAAARHDTVIQRSSAGHDTVQYNVQPRLFCWPQGEHQVSGCEIILVTHACDRTLCAWESGSRVHTYISCASHAVHCECTAPPTDHIASLGPSRGLWLMRFQYSHKEPPRASLHDVRKTGSGNSCTAATALCSEGWS